MKHSLLLCLAFSCSLACGAVEGPPSTATSAPPPPTSAIGGWNAASAKGCANFVVFAPNESGERFLVIDASKEALGLERLHDSKTVSFGTKNEAVGLRVDTYGKKPSVVPYCNDIGINDPQTPTSSVATEGSATFTISSVDRDTNFYAVTVALKDVVVRASDGSLEAIPDMTFKSIGVGWLPG